MTEDGLGNPELAGGDKGVCGLVNCSVTLQITKIQA